MGGKGQSTKTGTEREQPKGRRKKPSRRPKKGPRPVGDDALSAPSSPPRMAEARGFGRGAPLWDLAPAVLAELDFSVPLARIAALGLESEGALWDHLRERPELVLELGAAIEVRYATRETLRLLKARDAEEAKRNQASMLVEGTVPPLAEVLVSFFGGAGRVRVEAPLVALDGTPVLLDVTVAAGGDPPDHSRVFMAAHDLLFRRRRGELSANLEAVLRCSPNAMIAYSPGGRIQLWNPEAEKLFGYSVSEALGRPLFDLLVPPGLRPEAEILMERALSGEPVRGVETRMICRNGDQIPVALNLSRIEDSDGEVLGIVGEVRDLRADRVLRYQRDEARRMLERSEAHYRHLFESAPVAIWNVDLSAVQTSLNKLDCATSQALDRHLLEHPLELARLYTKVRIRDVNDAAVRLYRERSRTDLLITWPNAIPREGMDAMRAICLAIYEGRGTLRVDTQGRMPSGARLDIALTVGAPGEPPAWDRAVMLAEEITARKKAEEVALSHTAELARSNVELEQFAFDAAHDLMEPLAIVSRFAGLLHQRAAGSLEPTAAEWLGFIESEIARIREMVTKMLELSRLQSEQRPAEPVDCGVLLRELGESMHEALEASEATLRIGPMPAVRGDGVQLARVFRNLLGNALKFRGDAPPEIRIGARREGELWQIWVRDKGIGMDPADAREIFRPFRRLHPVDEYPGTGIGLAICARIVELHGGRIWAESKPGRGTTFRLMLPGAVEG